MCSWNNLPRRRMVCIRITWHHMPSEPCREQLREHCALNLWFVAVQDRADPISEHLDLVHLLCCHQVVSID